MFLLASVLCGLTTSASADDSNGAAPVPQSSLLWLAIQQCVSGKNPQAKPSQPDTAKPSEQQQPPVQQQKSPEVNAEKPPSEEAEARKTARPSVEASQAKQAATKADHAPAPQGGQHTCLHNIRPNTSEIIQLLLLRMLCAIEKDVWYDIVQQL